jgi:BASS family bile acid:Na+ symporter
MAVTELISKVFLPISLAIIMLGMGMTLIPDDFKRIFKMIPCREMIVVIDSF